MVVRLVVVIHPDPSPTPTLSSPIDAPTLHSAAGRSLHYCHTLEDSARVTEALTARLQRRYELSESSSMHAFLKYSNTHCTSRTHKYWESQSASLCNISFTPCRPLKTHHLLSQHFKEQSLALLIASTATRTPPLLKCYKLQSCYFFFL